MSAYFAHVTKTGANAIGPTSWHRGDCMEISALMHMPGIVLRSSNDNFAAAASESVPKVAILNPSRAHDESLSKELRVIFGMYLKAARLKRGLRQSDLADRTGLTAMRLSLIEGGHLDITFDTAMGLGRLVGLEASGMFKQSGGRLK